MIVRVKSSWVNKYLRNKENMPSSRDTKKLHLLLKLSRKERLVTEVPLQELLIKRRRLQLMKKKSSNHIIMLLALCMVFITGGYALGEEGAYVGSEKCKECHADVSKSFTGNIHSKAGAYGFKDAGCESCHGPASGHVASGDPGAIVNPSKIDSVKASENCLECHNT